MYGKLPHSPSKQYTNLALVKEAVSKEKVDAFTRATTSSDIDDDPHKKEPITMAEIGMERNGAWPKFILLEGTTVGVQE